MRPRRSVLYMPGSNERALEKAKTLAADSLILDLEDAVAPEAKDKARTQAGDAVRDGGFGRREVAIRINGLDTPYGLADLEMAATVRPDAILIPKVQTPDDINQVRAELAERPRGGPIQLWAMIETPLAILNIREIAAQAADEAAPLSCFVLGTNDLVKETRVRPGPDRMPLIPWLATTLAAGRAFGLDVIDGVYNNLHNQEGFRAECEQGRALGMDGKTLIHPGQIDICNEVFSPSPEEVEWARKVVAAFNLPENRDKGAIQVEGQMVERLHAESASRVIAIAELVANSG